MKRAAIYTRISDDKTGEEQGVIRQREDCEQCVSRRDWQLIGRYEDNDRSAKHANNRPDFNRLLKDITSGRIEVVVAWTWDRLTRNRKETVQLIEACQEHNVLISLVRGSDIDCSTAAGRLVADVLASVARNEIDQKSERQVRAYRQAAEQGKPHFVARPYGYTRQGELIEEEAAVLRQMAEKYLNGASLWDLRRWTEDEGIKSATGTWWTNRVIKAHLVSKRNAGIRVYKGDEFPGNWAPVWDLDMHERLVAENKRRNSYVNKGPHSNRRRYLLTGLLYCGRCDGPMNGHRRADRAGLPMRDKYNCSALERGGYCKGQLRVAETLEHCVREAVFARLDSPDLVKRLAQREAHADKIDPLRNKQQAINARMETLLDDYTDGTLTKSEYVRAKKRLSEQLQGITAELEHLYSSQQAATLLSAPEHVRAIWERETLGWRTKLLHLLIEKVTVLPTRSRKSYFIDEKHFKFDPESLVISWKA